MMHILQFSDPSVKTQYRVTGYALLNNTSVKEFVDTGFALMDYSNIILFIFRSLDG